MSPLSQLLLALLYQIAFANVRVTDIPTPN